MYCNVLANINGVNEMRLAVSQSPKRTSFPFCFSLFSNPFKIVSFFGYLPPKIEVEGIKNDLRISL
uniref:Uncharacterized protein n=1 Tax=Anguilla anguilla TaxID=7936 RepID=A0A0E9WCH5_ANGAN